MIISDWRLGPGLPRPARVVMLIAMLGVFVLGSVTGCDAQDSEPPSLDATMAAFLHALRDKDIGGLPDFFPSEGDWIYLGTITDPPRSSTVDRQQLSADFLAREGWYVVLVDADGDDCFCDYADITEGEPWVRLDDTAFEPPGDIGGGLVYVRWRLQGRRWVIDALAEPTS